MAPICHFLCAIKDTFQGRVEKLIKYTMSFINHMHISLTFSPIKTGLPMKKGKYIFFLDNKHFFSSHAFLFVENVEIGQCEKITLISSLCIFFFGWRILKSDNLK